MPEPCFGISMSAHPGCSATIFGVNPSSKPEDCLDHSAPNGLEVGEKTGAATPLVIQCQHLLRGVGTV